MGNKKNDMNSTQGNQSQQGMNRNQNAGQNAGQTSGQNIKGKTSQADLDVDTNTQDFGRKNTDVNQSSGSRKNDRSDV